MTSQDESTQTLTPERTAQIMYRIADDAARDAGFMVMFLRTKHPYRTGLCFFKSEGEIMAVAHGATNSIGEPLALTVSDYRTREHRQQFIQGNLRRLASEIGIPFEQLVVDIDNTRWRFVGYVNMKAGEWQDNSIAWRALWGRIVEVTAPGRIQTAVDPLTVAFLTKALQFCAIDGQIVLDR